MGSTSRTTLLNPPKVMPQLPHRRRRYLIPHHQHRVKAPEIACACNERGDFASWLGNKAACSCRIYKQGCRCSWTHTLWEIWTTCEHHVKYNLECCVVGPWCRSRPCLGSCLVSSRNGDQAWPCSLTYPFVSSRKLNVTCCMLSWLSMVDFVPFLCPEREREREGEGGREGERERGRGLCGAGEGRKRYL